MCVVNLESVNKLDLTWKQSFLIGGTHLGRLLALPKITRLGLKHLTEPNTLAYLASPVETVK